MFSKGVTQFKLVKSLGATEIYPFTGSSEIITDITSTGETLKANNLRILKDGEILKSQACLMISKKSQKITLNEDTEHIPNFIYLVKGFKKAKMPEPISEIKLRLTLDYREDYYLLRLIYDELGGGASRNQINELFLNNPVLHKINWFRRFDYLNNQTLMESGTQ